MWEEGFLAQKSFLTKEMERMKNLKKFLALFMVAAMTFSFVACSADSDKDKDKDNDKNVDIN